MSPETRRIVIPLVVSAVAVALLAAVFFGRGGSTSPATPATTPPAPAVAAATTTTGEATPSGPGSAPVPPAPLPPIADLHAIAPPGGLAGDAPPAPLGSFDPFKDRWKVEFAPYAAGIDTITFSDVWESAAGRHEADLVKTQIKAGTRTIDDLPAAERYVLRTMQPMGDVQVPILAAHSIVINGGDSIDLFGAVWTETAPGAFVTQIVDESGDVLLRITRRFVPGKATFDLRVEQRLENLSGQALNVRWIQFGPGDLRQDRSRYLDRRRFRFGYLHSPQLDPSRLGVFSDDYDVLFERADVVKRWDKAEDARKAGDAEAVNRHVTLWPNQTSRERGYELSWFASTNRYFGLAVHPVLPDPAAGSRAFTDVVETIQLRSTDTDQAAAHLFMYLFSPMHRVEPGATLALDMGVYAGPLDRHVLGEQQPYEALRMQGLILYQMSSFCAVCTFQWLAHGLLYYLSFLDSYVVFDWGVAIIILVMTVRLLLHPITKKSQISMQRFSKQMGSMKPELDRMRKKFGDDPKRMQQEQVRLFREHGVSPLGCLGFLPMFLQTPIWIALYAMLYFTFDLRQEPAFYGVFQLFGGWSFLADLSASDHFFGEFKQPFQFLLWNVTGINILPLLMGVIFFIQQKYMAPPPGPNVTPEQLQQQKMMRVITVVLFPLMLYSAPSGLTLYILTSSCIGILESRYVRQHITEMDLAPKKDAAATGPRKKRKKPRDAQGRAFASAMDRAKARSDAKRRGPSRSYKKKK